MLSKKNCKQVPYDIFAVLLILRDLMRNPFIGGIVDSTIFRSNSQKLFLLGKTALVRRYTEGNLLQFVSCPLSARIVPQIPIKNLSHHVRLSRSRTSGSHVARRYRVCIHRKEGKRNTRKPAYPF